MNTSLPQNSPVSSLTYSTAESTINLDKPVSNMAASGAIQGYMAIALLCGLFLSCFLYKQHRTYRSSVLKQQIAMLERLWKIESCDY
jgi:hypothetical protein